MEGSSSRSQKDNKGKLPRGRISVSTTDFNVIGSYKERERNVIQAGFNVKDHHDNVDIDEEQHKVKVIGKIPKSAFKNVLQSNHHE